MLDLPRLVHPSVAFRRSPTSLSRSISVRNTRMGDFGFGSRGHSFAAVISVALRRTRPRVRRWDGCGLPIRRRRHLEANRTAAHIRRGQRGLIFGSRTPLNSGRTASRGHAQPRPLSPSLCRLLGRVSLALVGLLLLRDASPACPSDAEVWLPGRVTSRRCTASCGAGLGCDATGTSDAFVPRLHRSSSLI